MNNVDEIERFEMDTQNLPVFLNQNNVKLFDYYKKLINNVIELNVENIKLYNVDLYQEGYDNLDEFFGLEIFEAEFYNESVKNEIIRMMNDDTRDRQLVNNLVEFIDVPLLKNCCKIIYKEFLYAVYYFYREEPDFSLSKFNYNDIINNIISALFIDYYENYLGSPDIDEIEVYQYFTFLNSTKLLEIVIMNCIMYYAYAASPYGDVSDELYESDYFELHKKLIKLINITMIKLVQYYRSIYDPNLIYESEEDEYDNELVY